MQKRITITTTGLALLGYSIPIDGYRADKLWLEFDLTEKRTAVVWEKNGDRYSCEHPLKYEDTLHIMEDEELVPRGIIVEHEIYLNSPSLKSAKLVLYSELEKALNLSWNELMLFDSIQELNELSNTRDFITIAHPAYKIAKMSE